MILKICNISIGWVIFKNYARCLISANNLSENTQHGIEKSRKRTLELCFLTTCFDVTCSCVKIDTCTSLNTNTDKNSGLTTFDTSLHCMILNTRINGAKNELEKQNNTPKRRKLFRLYKRVICNRMVVNMYLMKVCLK